MLTTTQESIQKSRSCQAKVLEGPSKPSNYPEAGSKMDWLTGLVLCELKKLARDTNIPIQRGLFIALPPFAEKECTVPTARLVYIVTYCKAVSVARDGIGDTSLLVPSVSTCKLVRADIVLGIDPVNVLIDKSSSVSAISALTVLGIVPVSRLSTKSRYLQGSKTGLKNCSFYTIGHGCRSRTPGLEFRVQYDSRHT